MLDKMIYLRPLAVSYGWTVLNITKLKCLIIHPVIKLQKDPYIMSVGHASVAPENPEYYL
jgi:hypothetical protein